jgi:hypothetical protein
MRAAGFHAAGLAVVVVIALVGFYTAAFASFVTSICNDTPGVVAAHRRALQAVILCVGFGIAAGPGLWAVLARRRQRAALPWAVASAVFGAATMVVALTAKPARWCLF